MTQSRVIQVACYSHELACCFWRLVHEWKVQSRGVHKDFHGSARDSLVGRPSSREKHLENFSQFCLWVFWQLALATYWRLVLVAKNACSAFWRQFLKLFQFFPRLFVTVHCLPHSSLNWNSPKHFVSLSTNSISAFFHLQIFKKKIWVLISSPHISCFELHFREYLCCCFIFIFFLCVFVMGLFWFLRLSLFGLLRYCSYANLFQLIDSCIIMCWFP